MSSPTPTPTAAPAAAAPAPAAPAPAPGSLKRDNQAMDSACNGCRCCVASKKVKEDNVKLRASNQRLIARLNCMTDKMSATEGILGTLADGILRKIDRGDLVVHKRAAPAAAAPAAAEPLSASVTAGDKTMKKGKQAKATVLFPCCKRLKKIMQLNQ